jgi:hypothetical protein
MPENEPNKPKGTFLCALALALACAGCLYPHDKPNVEYGDVPFRFGTNQPVELAATLRGTGTYHLYFLLRKDSVPQGGGGRAPVWLDAPVHVLVLTNGETALDKEVNRLQLINASADTINYSLTLFHGEQGSRAVCRVQGPNGGDLHGRGTLNLQQMRHH